MTQKFNCLVIIWQCWIFDPEKNITHVQDNLKTSLHVLWQNMKSIIKLFFCKTQWRQDAPGRLDYSPVIQATLLLITQMNKFLLILILANQKKSKIFKEDKHTIKTYFLHEHATSMHDLCSGLHQSALVFLKEVLCKENIEDPRGAIRSCKSKALQC